MRKGGGTSQRRDADLLCEGFDGRLSQGTAPCERAGHGETERLFRHKDKSKKRGGFGRCERETKSP